MAKPVYTKKLFLQELGRCYGVIQDACDAVNRNVITYDRWCKEDDDFNKKANDIIKKLLISGGGMMNLNSELDFERAEEIALEFDRLVEMEEQVDVIEEILKEDDKK